MPDLPESRSAGQTRLRSVPVEVRVCVGHARPTVAELLELRQDAVLPLDRRIEDPVELYVGDRLGLDYGEDREFGTAAGYALHVLKRLPNEGDHFTDQGWRFEVVDMDGRRIDRVLITRTADSSDAIIG